MRYFSFILCFIFFTCEQKEDLTSSKLLLFDYMGYSDTTCAALIGEIFLLSENGDTLPAKNVEIKCWSKNLFGKDHTVLTDSLGQFGVCNDEGEHEIKINKNGFQSVILTNYFSHGHQISRMKFLLLKGDKKVEIVVPDENKCKS